MATIDDLPIKNFSEMSDEELLALVKDVRGRRRNPPAEVKEATMKKVMAKKKQGKAVALKSAEALLKGVKNLSKEQAAEMLRMLGGASNG